MKLSDYRQIWCVDTEFIPKVGERPVPVCLCAVEARTGEERVAWLADGASATPPIPLCSDVLFVTYSGRAELSVYLTLGWPMPVNVLDLHIEHLLLTNGKRWETCKLTSLRRQLGLSAPADEHKEAMRQRIMAGPPFSMVDQKKILAYCLEDARMLVTPVQVLLKEQNIALAVGARGEFIQVAALMEHYGIPIDTEIYAALRRHLPAIWQHFVTEIDRFGLYDQGHFRHHRLDNLVNKFNLDWPRTQKGNLKTDEETWDALASLYPDVIGPYANLRHIASWLREGLDLRVGHDGRSRPATFPFQQKTGRTSPSGSFLFSLPKWLRGLLKPVLGTVFFYSDYSQQEPALAAFLSGDEGLLRCYNSSCGSFYVALMIECGAAPGDATKQSHPHVHQTGKVLLLAITYGAGANFIARQLEISTAEGDDVLKRLKRAFPTFFAWREKVLLDAQWRGCIETPDGWRQVVDSRSNPRSLYNFPMQASGAAMTRCAAILASKGGLRVLGTVHDALICEAHVTDRNSLARMHQSMDGGANLLAPGCGIRHEVEIVQFPGRYAPDDQSARTFWNKVIRVLASEERCDPQPWLMST